MEIGLNLPVYNTVTTPAMLAEIARAAEDFGFAELFLMEHVVRFDQPSGVYPTLDHNDIFYSPSSPLPDPLVTHAFVAAATRRIRLATGVLLLPQRNPVYTAKNVATLDWLSGGRFDLTIGVGWSEEEYVACDTPWAERGDRCDDYIEVMRSLWADDVSSFQGRFYRLPPCRQYPKPVQRPHPPLWFGGWSKPALSRAARVGNGWYGFELQAADVAEHVAQLYRMLAEHGRPHQVLKILCGGYQQLPANREELRAYRDAGVDQFVFSFTETEPKKMMDQLKFYADEFIGA